MSLSAFALLRMNDHKKSSKYRHAGSLRLHQRRRHAAIHKTGQFPRPLENPVQTVDRNQMKPGCAKRLDGISASRRLHEHDMKFIDADKPVNETDKIGKEKIERRHEEWFLKEFRMPRGGDHFGDQRRHAEKVTHPDARKSRQRPWLRPCFL